MIIRRQHEPEISFVVREDGKWLECDHFECQACTGSYYHWDDETPICVLSNNSFEQKEPECHRLKEMLEFIKQQAVTFRQHPVEAVRFNR